MRLHIGGRVINLEFSQRTVTVLLVFGIVTLLLWNASLAPAIMNASKTGKNAGTMGATPVESNPGELEINPGELEINPGERKAKAPGPVERDGWPKDLRRSFRMDDLLQGGPKKSGKKSFPVAMEAAAPRRNSILRTQKDLIRGQRRAPDSRYNINVTNSDLQSLDRDVPDIRPPICRHFSYDIDSLPAASVVIPFYNEALTMLLRTVHSILNRSPDRLLTEIILVDDCSTDEHLKAPLDKYLRLLPKVTLIRNRKRVGLIVSRMTGARAARGPVLIFLDAHTEANHGWLEPLLDEIKRNKKQILQPFVDAIDAMTLDIGPAGVFHKGSFSWDLRYTWLRVTDHEQAQAHEAGHPFFTPTLVGCAIAVDKQYFFDVGAFDEGLKIWGGENIELGFRVWMCGGKVTTVTCSHVGHVFKEFPYRFDGDKEEIVQKNLMRIAEAWMDGVKKFFYASTRIYEFKRAEFNEEDLASLEERKALRKRLGCRNFEWFLYNVIPQVEVPPANARFYGEITNTKTKACWEVKDDYFVGMTYICYFHKIIPENNFALTPDGLLRFKDRCVKITAPTPSLVVAQCPSGPDGTPPDNDEIEKFGFWEFEKTGTISGRLVAKRLNGRGVMEFWCITQVTNVLPQHKGAQMPQLGGCGNEFQEWSFTYGFDFSRIPKDIS